MSNNIVTVRPAVGDHIKNKSKCGFYVINRVEGRGGKRSAFCGHTQYFVENLSLISAGGTRTYPTRTWRYVGASKGAKKG